MSKTYRWILQSTVTLREESEEQSILYDSRTGKIIVINFVALVICRYLNQQMSLDCIIERIRAYFLLLPDNIENKVRDFLQFLVAENFVSVFK